MVSFDLSWSIWTELPCDDLGAFTSCVSKVFGFFEIQLWNHGILPYRELGDISPYNSSLVLSFFPVFACSIKPFLTMLVMTSYAI